MHRGLPSTCYCQGAGQPHSIEEEVLNLLLSCCEREAAAGDGVIGWPGSLLVLVSCRVGLCSSSHGDCT